MLTIRTHAWTPQVTRSLCASSFIGDLSYSDESSDKPIEGNLPNRNRQCINHRRTPLVPRECVVKGGSRRHSITDMGEWSNLVRSGSYGHPVLKHTVMATLKWNTSDSTIVCENLISQIKKTLKIARYAKYRENWLLHLPLQPLKPFTKLNTVLSWWCYSPVNLIHSLNYTKCQKCPVFVFPIHLFLWINIWCY